MSSLSPAITLPRKLQSPRSPSTTPLEYFRVIAFGIGPYTFALPMGVIAKVIHCPPLQTPGLGRTGLIHLERQVIRILDLHALAHPAESQGALFLVIARRSNGELYGIPVDTPPDLLELKRSQVQPLPSSTKQDPILSLARLIAVLPGEPTADTETGEPSPESTILLLDLDRASL